MKILSGKHRGATARLHQFANDWITADIGDLQSVILKPPQIELDDDEYQRMYESYLRFARGERTAGQFWRHWELRSDGRLYRRPPEPGHPARPYPAS